MSRNKLSEYQSKNIVNSIIGNKYIGWSIGSDLGLVDEITGYEIYVVKVDQAVKKRFKNGLVALSVKKSNIVKTINSFQERGYEHFIVEPYIQHESSDERYISFQRDRSGILVSYSASGGVDIEDNLSTLESWLLTPKTMKKTSAGTGLSVDVLKRFHDKFNELHLTLLEINPYIITRGTVSILDSAIEVDSAAIDLVDGWSEADIRYPVVNHTQEELAVRFLNDDSPASFNLSVLNKNGSIFLLLSGGGASVVIADEIYSSGFGKEIANYGEYSGNPSRHETYLYTRQVLSLMNASSASAKVLFIGGAVANFTDIATTFNGVIDALQEQAKELINANVKVYVRRGGPREEEGLNHIKQVLKEMGILGGVYDPSTSIPFAVKKLVEGVKRG